MLELNVEYYEKNDTLLTEKATKIVQNQIGKNKVVIWILKDTSPNKLLQRWITEDGQFMLLKGINENDGKFAVRKNF